MNNQEAIKVIKDNYPTENYTMLREALDLAIALLSEEGESMNVERQEINVTTDDGELVASFSLDEDNAIVKNGYKIVSYNDEYNKQE